MSHNADTHTLVLIFPAETIRKVDAIRATTGETRVEVLARAVEAIPATQPIPYDA